MLIGLVSYAVAGRVRVPPLVVVVSVDRAAAARSVDLPRALLLSEGGNGLGCSMINAAAIAIALASGVIFGEYLAQPLKREARRLEGRLSGPRLVGPLRARTVRRRTAATTDPR